MKSLQLLATGHELPLAALIDSARMAEQAGELDEALDLYNAALRRIHAGEMPESGPQVLRWIGRVLFGRSDYEGAHRAYEASLVNAQALGRRNDACSALNGMAVVEQFRGRLDVAEALYERASVLADEAGDFALAAMIDQNLGILANVRGDLSTALIRYQAALERFRELGNSAASARVLNNMGMLHVDIGEFAAAELCFNSAYTLAENLGDKTVLSRVEMHRAELYLKKQNYERARECCERSFKLCSELGSEAGLGEVHKFYGVLYRETGKPQVAQVQLNLALKVAKSCDNPMLEAEVESERAKLFVAQRRVNDALQSLNRAHRIFQGLDARREILDLRRRLERLESTYLDAVQLWAEDAPAVAAPLMGRSRGRRVAELATQLGAALGYEDLNTLRIGAYLHDVGNQAVPSSLLEKNGSLSNEELEHVKLHTLYGDLLVKELEFSPEVRPMVRNHHEHWDGTGYPDRLKGEDIPLSARILTIVDVYDALTSKRSYREAFSPEAALSIMAAESGKLLDPTLFLTFASMIKLGSIAPQPEETQLLREAI